ncbi:MAG: hypothetical protein IT406_02510 [Candidatus Yanofskybacteria bacterium]|nr:hypothetical protein [Candidatus Yanofskybacteria bacterium]
MAEVFPIRNPIGVDNLQDLFAMLSERILDIVIPIAVLMYVWAGVNLLIAAGDTGKIKKAKDIMKWTTAGLLIIFIGGGFVDLIRSILNAG